MDVNESVRLVLSRMLSRHREFEVVGESDCGESACERLESANPEVVLMDVVMAGMGGVEAARRISQLHPTACIIGMSATEHGERIDAIRAAGAVDFVPKTTSVDQLMRAMQAVVAVRRFPSKNRQD